MYKVVENTMVVNEDNIMRGVLALTNETEDSSVIFEGSDSLDDDNIDCLEKMKIVFQNLPKDIKVLQFEKYSVTLEGDTALELMVDIVENTIKAVKARLN